MLFGNDGNDFIAGGEGKDHIVGGAGRDIMNGGADSDTFVFTALSDTGLGANADHITDFVSGVDLIDLAAIDANTGRGLTMPSPS